MVIVLRQLNDRLQLLIQKIYIGARAQSLCTGYRKTIGIYTIQKKLEVNSTWGQSTYKAHVLRRNLQPIKGDGEGCESSPTCLTQEIEIFLVCRFGKAITVKCNIPTL
mgnify:CR=1 FL=1